jgi:hypothetical protein
MALTFREAPTEMGLHPNILLYGPPKSGKTLGACSAPKPLVLLNADLPNASYQAHRRYGSQLMEAELEGLQTMIDVIMSIKHEMTKEIPAVAAVVVDPIADLHRTLMEEESNRAIRPSIVTYGNTAVHIERFCRELCRLPVTTVLVCHETVVRDESTGGFERLPYTGTTNPTLGSKLMAMVDIIGYTGVMETDDGGRTDCAQLTPGGGRRGGDRFTMLGDWQPLDITNWLEILQSETSTKEMATA